MLKYKIPQIVTLTLIPVLLVFYLLTNRESFALGIGWLFENYNGI